MPNLVALGSIVGTHIKFMGGRILVLEIKLDLLETFSCLTCNCAECGNSAVTSPKVKSSNKKLDPEGDQIYSLSESQNSD